jgi:phosphomannomutase
LLVAGLLAYAGLIACIIGVFVTMPFYGLMMAAAYDRLDLRLPDMAARSRLEARLAQAPPSEVAGAPVREVITTDGVKLRLGPNHWLMLRFSGTEPLLRLYCEAPTAERVAQVLDWARKLAEGI